jgi:hypothetical protein
VKDEERKKLFGGEREVEEEIEDSVVEIVGEEAKCEGKK